MTMNNQQYIEQWKNELETVEGKSKKTLLNYPLHLTKFANFLDEKSLSFMEVTKSLIREYFGSFKTKKGNSASIATKKAHQAAIQSFYNWMTDEGRYIEKYNHPLLDGISFGKETKEKKYFKHEDVDAIKDFLESECKLNLRKTLEWEEKLEEKEKLYQNYPANNCKRKIKRYDINYDYCHERDVLIFNLMINSGMRKTELINIRIEDLDLNGKIATVLVTRKGNKKQRLPLCNDIRNDLKKYLNKFEIKNGYIFLREYANGCKEQLSEYYITYLFKKIKEKTGIDINPHRTRKIFATHLKEIGVDAVDIKDLLGHESISTTMIYLEGNPDRLGDVVNKLNKGVI
jgi:site-specific recombinase XerD